MSLKHQGQVLAHYRPWILAEAREINGGPGWRVQDLAQEGWIEMWARLSTDSWNKRLPQDLALKLHARDRMKTVRRNWLSMKNSIAEPPSTSFGDSPMDELLWTTSLGEVEWAYHHGEIHRVICEQLSPREREYVYLRFWCGYQLPEMRAHFGYNPSTLWKTARAKLSEALSSLVSV